MRRVGYLLLILLLAACGTANVAVPTAEPADEAPEPEPTRAGDTNTEQGSQPASGDAIAPAQTPAEAGVIRERDWTKGAENPLVTIIEYGDFQ